LAYLYICVCICTYGLKSNEANDWMNMATAKTVKKKTENTILKWVKEIGISVVTE